MRRIPSTKLGKLVKTKNLANYTELIKLGNLSDLSLESTKYANATSKRHEHNLDFVNKSKHCASLQRMRQAAKLHLQKKEHEKLGKSKIFKTHYQLISQSDL